MKKALILLAGIICLGSVAPLGGAEFWEKKKYTQWTERDVRKMLTDSPWARQHTEAETPSDLLAASPGEAGAQSDESGAGAAPTGDTEGGRRPRQQLARQTYRFQIRSALPIRQALVRLGQLQQGYDGMPAEQKQTFDQEANQFLTEGFSDRVVFYVSFSSTQDIEQRELTRHWKAQTTETLKDSVFLIGAKGLKAELREYTFAGEGRAAFQFTFPRTVDGQALVGPQDKSLQLEFLHPNIRGRGKRRVLVEFKLSKMLLEGKLEY